MSENIPKIKMGLTGIKQTKFTKNYVIKFLTSLKLINDTEISTELSQPKTKA